MAAFDQLLVVVDPVARRADGESVRIAKDVLGAGATLKVCLPDGPEEFAKALVRRGSRRPVVIGDDRALLRAVALLHRERELAGSVLSFVPVGASLSLARSLGVPTDAVAAARTALEESRGGSICSSTTRTGWCSGICGSRPWRIRRRRAPIPRTTGCAPASPSSARSRRDRRVRRRLRRGRSGCGSRRTG